MDYGLSVYREELAAVHGEQAGRKSRAGKSELADEHSLCASGPTPRLMAPPLAGRSSSSPERRNTPGPPVTLSLRPAMFGRKRRDDDSDAVAACDRKKRLPRQGGIASHSEPKHARKLSRRFALMPCLQPCTCLHEVGLNKLGEVHREGTGNTAERWLVIRRVLPAAEG